MEGKIPFEINDQFKKAIDLLESGKNLILTGRAGTGKSTFLNYFCQNTKKQFVLLAPTGVAAVNIGGQTIHSFCKFKPGVTFDEARNSGKKSQKNKMYQHLQILIIDEISMVRCDLLDCIDIFLRTARKNNLPFGGVQTFFVGDLYQLPPVVTSNETKTIDVIYETPYFFSSKVMQGFSSEFIEFEKIYRQKDQYFIELLNGIRNKTISDEMLEALNSRFMPDFDENKHPEYIYLASRNAQAEMLNEKNLNYLPGKVQLYPASVEGNFSSEFFPASANLTLKKDARVMLLNNDSKGRWINGSLGWVKKMEQDFINVALDQGGKFDVYPYLWEIYEGFFDEREKTIKRRTIGSFLQIPVQLAWAITIHKSQGKTFDKAIVDIGKGTFTPGQVYVALSRCRSLDGLVLKKRIEKKHIWLDRRVVKFITQYQYQRSEQSFSFEDKACLVKKAIKEKRRMNIVYLKASDEKSRRVILPKRIYETEYNGYAFTAVDAYCFLRKQKRVFNLKRILEMRIIDS